MTSQKLIISNFVGYYYYSKITTELHYNYCITCNHTTYTFIGTLVRCRTVHTNLTASVTLTEL